MICSNDDLTDEQKENEDYVFDTILEQMQICRNKHKSWDVHVKQDGLKVNGIYCRFDWQTDITGNRFGKISVKKGDDKTHVTDFYGGNWYERVVARAIEKTDGKFVHSGVKIPYGRSKNNDQCHREEMDVVCSYGNTYFLISCKAFTIGSKKAPNLKSVAEDVNNMAASLNCFAIGAMCFLHKDREDRTVFPDEQDIAKKPALKGVFPYPLAVFDCNDLNDPEKLNTTIQALFAQRRAHS